MTAALLSATDRMRASGQGGNGSLLPAPGGDGAAVGATRDLWVDKDSLGGPCSDSRAATSVTRTAPWCTLWAALSRVVPGDLVHVRGGTYTESLRPITAGTASQWIRFAAEPGEIVTLQGGGDVTNGIQLWPSAATPSFNEISGFHVRNMSHNCILVDSVPDVRLINLEASGCGIGAVELHQTQRVTLEGSRIHDSNTTGWTSAIDLFECRDGNVIRGNWVWSNSDSPAPPNADTEGHGLTMDTCGAAGGALIENNVFWNNEGWGISIYKSDGATIRNNTLYQNGIRAGGEIMSLGNRVAIHNNILVPRSGRVALNMRYTGSSYAVDPATLQENYDAIGVGAATVTMQWGDSSGTVAQYRAGNPKGWGGSSTASDPSFANATAADFHLTAGSTARDTGDNSHAASIDIEGRARPVGTAVDRGAYEYQAGTPTVPPAPPAGPAMTLDKTALQFSAINRGGAFTKQTAVQTVRLTQSGAGGVTWTATSNQSWLAVTPASGSGPATLSIGVQFANGLPAAGSVTGAIALTLTGAGNTAGPINVTLTVLQDGTSAAPFGVIDTPLENTTGVSGAIPVTGWALDDVEVAQVRVWRDPVPPESPGAQVFVGDAVRIRGARPDVAAAYPGYPFNDRAGWGFMLLTNMLPNQGNGTYAVYVYATDAEGRQVSLGRRTFTASNATAIRPFGAIDTPAQGETISGTSYNNFGWVLSRGPALAYPPSGTVSVVIDGVFGAAPGGWSSRPDLTALFPAATYPGVTHALGVTTFDTTKLANGVHTIAWVVTASNGQADGIGSRYFTVANGSSVVGSGFQGPASALRTPGSEPQASAPGSRTPDPGPRLDTINAAPLDVTAISARRGYDSSAPFRPVAGDGSGGLTVHGEELDRVELRLDDTADASYTGYQRVGDGLQPLPIGSHLEGATFTWQPGVGFLGAYDLVFVRADTSGALTRREVRIVLNPKGSNRVGPQVVIDTPASQVDVAQPFALGGWAVDLNDAAGTGIDALHVWAYPVGSGDPIFLGVATYGGARPDVAALFGDRFGASGYGLTVRGLAPGNYDLAVFAWSTATGGFVPAKVVRVTIR